MFDLNRSRKLFCLLMLLGFSHVAPALETGTLVVEIEGLKDASGNVFIAVYDSRSTWLGDEPVADQKVVIEESLQGDVVRAELALPHGEYAMSVFYDKNNDGKLNTNFIGIPREPIALSNNATAKFGPPKYEDAAFTVGAEPAVQRISMGQL